jgi:hypothetical protein
MPFLKSSDTTSLCRIVSSFACVSALADALSRTEGYWLKEDAFSVGSCFAALYGLKRRELNTPAVYVQSFWGRQRHVEILGLFRSCTGWWGSRSKQLQHTPKTCHSAMPSCVEIADPGLRPHLQLADCCWSGRKGLPSCTGMASVFCLLVVGCGSRRAAKTEQV